jgi:molecular chaperone DnaK
MVTAAEAHAEEDKKRKALVEARNHAESLIHSTEKSLQEHGSKISETEKGDIETALNELKDALSGEDAEALQAKTNTLVQASMKLGEAIYRATQEQGGAGAHPESSSPGGEKVVDAEYEEVDESKKNQAE